MAAQVSDLLDRKNPTVAPYAKSGEALLRVTAKADSREQAEAMCDQVVGEIRDRLGSLIYGVDTPGLEYTAVELLKKSGKKLALAESCTAGYIAKRITEVPGASEVFECGIVSYANKIKEKLLGVSEQTLAEQGAVCADVARQMAEGVFRLSGADIAVSVTGIAGPDPSEGGKPAGLSYLALTDGTHTYIRKVTTGHAGEGSREYNRYVSSSNALDMVRLYLQGHLDQIGTL
ncbi:MAG: nicotinamide-nucleotide amidohydrolase family protein [Clostridia bacterium]